MEYTSDTQPELRRKTNEKSDYDLYICYTERMFYGAPTPEHTQEIIARIIYATDSCQLFRVTCVDISHLYQYIPEIIMSSSHTFHCTIGMSGESYTLWKQLWLPKLTFALANITYPYLNVRLYIYDHMGIRIETIFR